MRLDRPPRRISVPFHRKTSGLISVSGPVVLGLLPENVAQFMVPSLRPAAGPVSNGNIDSTGAEVALSWRMYRFADLDCLLLRLASDPAPRALTGLQAGSAARSSRHHGDTARVMAIGDPSDLDGPRHASGSLVGPGRLLLRDLPHALGARTAPPRCSRRRWQTGSRIFRA